MHATPDSLLLERKGCVRAGNAAGKKAGDAGDAAEAGPARNLGKADDVTEAGSARNAIKTSGIAVQSRRIAFSD
ncbi:hypothetical protein [Paraburkholderia bryophila]|uniref:hypothetical protein n=1 Tax=Paraburkholderia bryophila TaxID=420952 RepID=UPI0011BFA3BD|nr:hypothetical protein [Paraburkholderia bryophila]